MGHRIDLIVAVTAGLAVACDGTSASRDQGGADQSSLIAAANQSRLQKVGGTVSGLAGTGLVLELNGTDALAVRANGHFDFGQRLLPGADYEVTVKAQPTSVVQTCTVSNGTGVVAGKNVKTVVVGCSPTGSYRETGSLSFAPRYHHTATRLLDGRVLVAGGHPDASTMWADATASAELYDPETGTFTPTGSMTVGRCGHTATLLPDGKVLIVGGWTYWWYYGWVTLRSAELYDPATGSFRPVGTMHRGRMGHTATLLNSGKVLVIDGYFYDWGMSSDAEIYDPSTETFTFTGSPISWNRWNHSAALLGDGQVLLVGGHSYFLDPGTYCYYDDILMDPSSCQPIFAELFNPVTGTFVRLHDHSGELSGIFSTTLLPSGKVLVAYIGRALLYDPSTQQFNDAVGAPLEWPSTCGNCDTPPVPATPLANGTVLLGASTVFDPSTLALTPTGGIEQGWELETATLLLDGKVLVLSGTSPRAFLYETIPPK